MSIVNYVRPTVGQDRKDINRLLELITDFTAAPFEDAGFQERVAVSPENKVRTTSVRFGGIDFSSSDTRQRDAQNTMMKIKMPNTPKSDPLIPLGNWAGSIRYNMTMDDRLHWLANGDAQVNNFNYTDISSVTDYVVQAGDFLEYDIIVHPHNNPVEIIQQVGMDLHFTTPSVIDLRNKGLLDQNGFSWIGNHSAYSAQGKWYHRKTDLTGGAFDLTGYNISQYNLVNECNAGTWDIEYSTIRITDGATPIPVNRKNIFITGDVPSFTQVLNATAENITHDLTAVGDKTRINFPPTDTIFGARYQSNGDIHSWYLNHAILNPSTKFAFAMWLKLSDTVVDEWVRNILIKTNNYIIRRATYVATPNMLQFYVYTGAGDAGTPVQPTYTPDVWQSWVFTYDSTVGLEVFRDGVSVGTVAKVAAATSGTGSFNIMNYSNVGQGGITGIDQSGNGNLAWFLMLNDVPTQNWITNFHNGFINLDPTDTDGFECILMNPMLGGEEPLTPATTNYAHT